MKNMKSTKRSLFLSAMALLLCTSMLIGTTYAWFTESVSSVNNIITGGNLDVELKWSADGSTFAVAVQCMTDPKPREYYYNLTEDWRAATAAEDGSFFVRLGYHIDDAEKMFKAGDKFSLVSFRGADCPTSVIVLNGLILSTN